MLLLALAKQPCDTVITQPKLTGVVPARYYTQVTQKANKVARNLDRQSMLAVSALLEREQRMQNLLARKDPEAAARVFQAPVDSLRQLKAKLQHKLPLGGGLKVHNETIDSLAGTLAFLKENKALGAVGSAGGLESTSEAVNALEERFQSADQVRAFLQAQKATLNEQLASYSALGQELKALNQQAYYYSQQLNEYKELLHDRKRAEAKALVALQQLPAYRNFMAQHSQLAALFNLQGAAGSQSLAGLQTRNAVGQVIQQRLAGADASAVTGQMDAARGQLQTLRDKYAGLNSAGEMPDFKPKELKTKSLRQRLEFGANTQFEKSSRFFPTTADIAGQVAYKFSKNGSVGMGASYKLGMGTYNHVQFTSQGMGVRSFLEWRIKQSLYANGGFEENYTIPFASLSNLYSLNQWIGSALLGISKKIQLNSKLKTNVMLLYDFLWASHSPTTQPLLLRMGYNF
ncbi:hypothetical protein DCC81_21300 [Chitinophaga parva]|uniref:Uncharacterized protein n=2 Tax=Chitinophaga parva TaxID=2169414 RepID=A0A2T7BCY8_9BACT|nr:hypothetical protein DCC81_21300 [Chitinophaga parva]